MTASTNVPYWVVALRVGCVLSQVIAASGDLSLKLSLTPEYKFTNNGLSLTSPSSQSHLKFFRVESRELSSHFESLVYKLVSMSSHTKFHVFSTTFFCYEMEPNML